jgi:hypothetical protein
MFRQFKEKNKNLLRLKLKSALKIEQISVVLWMRFILNRKSEFIIYWFIINHTILYPLGGGGGLWWKFEIKTQDRTLSKNNNPGLFVSMIFFFLKVNNMKYWHPHLAFGQHISVSTLVLYKKKATNASRIQGGIKRTDHSHWLAVVVH